MTKEQANTNTANTTKVAKAVNEFDVEIEKLKADLAKQEMEIGERVAEWRLEKELKHKKFIRVTEAIERLAMVGIAAGTIGYVTNKNTELEKHELEFGQE